MYIKSISTPQKVTKLQLNLQLNEHKGQFLDEKQKKINQYEQMYNLIIAPQLQKKH